MEKQGPIQKTQGANSLTPDNITKRRLVGDFTRLLQERVNYLEKLKINDCPSDRIKRRLPPKKKRKKRKKRVVPPPVDPFGAIDILLKCDSKNDIEENMKEYFDSYPRKKKGPPSKQHLYIMAVSDKMEAFFDEIEKIERVAARHAKSKRKESVGELEKRLRDLKKTRDLRLNIFDELAKIPKSLKSTAARIGTFVGTFGITSAILYKVLKSGIEGIFGSHAGMAALGALGLLSFVANQPIMAMISNRAKIIVENNYNKKKMEIKKEMRPKIERVKREMREIESEYVSKVQKKLTTFAGSVLWLCRLNYSDYLRQQYPEIRSGDKLIKEISADRQVFERIRRDLAVYAKEIYDMIDTQLEEPMNA